MKILYDENIPFGKEAFSTLGEVQSCSGREITSEMLKGIDLLFVRSVTKVNSELLEGTNVKFVATATSGSDHIDKDYLSEKYIFFKDAIGSNANSVAEYITAALLFLAEKNNFELAGKSIGIIGVGHVGSLVAKKAEALGLKCLLNDPPRKRAEPDFQGVTFEEAISADIVTFHVPLTFDDPDATFHLLNEKNVTEIFDFEKSKRILLQTSRGGVAETSALKLLKNKAALVLDVWENEPNIDSELLLMADIATPHIAGYSWTSKVEATNIIYKAACEFICRQPSWAPPKLPEGYETPEIFVKVENLHHEQFLAVVMKQAYDIEADDNRMREACSCAEEELGKNFDLLRKNYPIRLEAHQLKIKAAPEEIKPTLSKLGFQI